MLSFLHVLVQDFYQWCYYSNDYAFVRNSPYALPILQALHMAGIILLLGMTLVLNLRLLDVGFRDSPLPLLADDLWPWAKTGLVLAICTGAMVFLADPARYAESPSFRLKICLFFVATLYQSTLFRRIVRKNPEVRAPAFNAMVAAVSILLWLGVSWSGRTTGLFQ